jgi:hypothetical protein
LFVSKVAEIGEPQRKPVGIDQRMYLAVQAASRTALTNRLGVYFGGHLRQVPCSPTLVTIRCDTFADGDLFLTEEQSLPVFVGVFEPAATQISLGAALLATVQYDCRHSKTCRQPLKEVARVVPRF